jgi:hypothetical protein
LSRRKSSGSLSASKKPKANRPVPSGERQRYCEMCDEWCPHAECWRCGAPTQKRDKSPSGERE